MNSIENAPTPAMISLGHKENLVEKSSHGLTIVAWSQQKPSAYIFDLDNTLYQNPLYKQHVEEAEIRAIAQAQSWRPDQAPTLFENERKKLSQKLGRSARITETVLALGLNRNWWDTARDQTYTPEQFIQADKRITNILKKILDEGKKIAVATNSPKSTAVRILQALEVNPSLLNSIMIVSAGDIGISKPDPDFFSKIAQRLHVSTQECFSIGDDMQNDAYPAIEQGMGATLVESVDDISIFIESMQNSHYFSEVDLPQLAHSVYRHGEIVILGLTGRAGSGKTTTAENLSKVFYQSGITADVLGLDAFFKFSSRERKAWIEDPDISEIEFSNRRNQINWWDFDLAVHVLQQLKKGHSIHLTNVYDRNNKGEKTGEIKIDTNKKGHVIIFEGVATAHLAEFFDNMIYINAHDTVRKKRVLERDIQRRGVEEAKQRWEITQTFENWYFQQYNPGNGISVIDNSREVLTHLPSCIPLL